MLKLILNNDKNEITTSPVVNCFLKQLSPASIDFKNTVFICIQHLIPQTTELVKAFCYLGALPKKIFILGKIYSTENPIPDELKKLDIQVTEPSAETSHYPTGCSYSEVYQKDIEAFFSSAAQIISQSIKYDNDNIKQIILLDDGGRLITYFQELLNDNKNPFSNNIKISAVEQTSAGVDLIAGQYYEKLFFPVVEMASSTLKRITEAGLIGEQFADKFFNKIPISRRLMDNNKLRIGINGYGKIGQRIAEFLLKKLEKDGNSYMLYIYELGRENGRKLQQDSLFNSRITICHSLFNLVFSAQFIIGSTGCNAFEQQKVDRSILFSIIDENKHFFSSSSENIEFFSIIQFLSQSQINCKKRTSALDDLIYKHNNHKITIHNGGYPFNFSGKKPSVELSKIQGTLVSLLACVVQAHCLAISPTQIYKDPLIVYNAKLQLNALVDLIKEESFFQTTIQQPQVKIFDDLQKVSADSYYYRMQESFSGRSQKRYGKVCKVDIVDSITKANLNEVKSMLSQENQKKEIRWNLPPCVSYFVERKNEKEKIISFLKESIWLSSKKLVLFGPSGCGKTFLISDLINTDVIEQYDFVAFFRTNDYIHLAKEFLQLGVDLGLVKVDDRTDIDYKVKFITKFIEEHYKNILLIFDSVENPIILSDFIPKKRAHVLITSENEISNETNHEVGFFSADEIKGLLRKQSKELLRKQSIENSAQKLLKCVGSHPISLAIVSSFISESKLSVEEYCKDQKKELAPDESRVTELIQKTKQHIEGIIDRLDDQSLYYKIILQLISYLSPHGISRFLLINLLNSCLKALNMELISQSKCDELLCELDKYRLVVLIPGSLYIHKHLQTVLRELILLDLQKMLLGHLIQYFNQVLESHENHLGNNLIYWNEIQDILHHIPVVIEHAHQLIDQDQCKVDDGFLRNFASLSLYKARIARSMIRPDSEINPILKFAEFCLVKIDPENSSVSNKYLLAKIYYFYGDVSENGGADNYKENFDYLEKSLNYLEQCRNYSNDYKVFRGMIFAARAKLLDRDLELDTRNHSQHDVVVEDSEEAIALIQGLNSSPMALFEIYRTLMSHYMITGDEIYVSKIGVKVKEVLNQHPESKDIHMPRIHIEMTKLYIKNKEYGQARQELDLALQYVKQSEFYSEFHPRMFEIKHFLTVISALEGKEDQAIKLINEIVIAKAQLKGTSYINSVASIGVSTVAKFSTKFLISLYFDTACSHYQSKHNNGTTTQLMLECRDRWHNMQYSLVNTILGGCTIS